MMRMIINRAWTFLKDPIGVEKDWNNFRNLSHRQLRSEYHRLLICHPYSHRFNRLCAYLAVQWVYQPHLEEIDNAREDEEEEDQ